MGNLGMAYSMKRKGKKMAEGGEVRREKAGGRDTYAEELQEYAHKDKVTNKFNFPGQEKKTAANFSEGGKVSDDRDKSSAARQRLHMEGPPEWAEDITMRSPSIAASPMSHADGGMVGSVCESCGQESMAGLGAGDENNFSEDGDNELTIASVMNKLKKKHYGIG